MPLDKELNLWKLNCSKRKCTNIVITYLFNSRQNQHIYIWDYNDMSNIRAVRVQWQRRSLCLSDWRLWQNRCLQHDCERQWPRVMDSSYMEVLGKVSNYIKLLEWSWVCASLSILHSLDGELLFLNTLCAEHQMWGIWVNWHTCSQYAIAYWITYWVFALLIATHSN